MAAILMGAWDVFFGLGLLLALGLLCALGVLVYRVRRILSRDWRQRVSGLLGGLLMLAIGVAMEVLR